MSAKGEVMNKISKIKTYLEKYELKKYFENFDYNLFTIGTFEKNSFLMMSGMNENKLYFFVDGLIKVTLLSKGGNEMLLELSRPFDVMGDVEFILEDSIYYNIQIKEKSTFLILDFDVAYEIPGIYKLLAKTVAKKLRKTSKKYSMSKLCSSRIIAAEFIYENREYFSGEIRYREFAKLIGLSERQLRRILTEFENMGLIKRGDGGIRILNKEGIKEILENN
jgi:CRP-like cAMP-binding protein